MSIWISLGKRVEPQAEKTAIIAMFMLKHI
jgi:hypothetical protein